jgi:hypothetical protein
MANLCGEVGEETDGTANSVGRRQPDRAWNARPCRRHARADDKAAANKVGDMGLRLRSSDRQLCVHVRVRAGQSTQSPFRQSLTIASRLAVILVEGLAAGC